MNVIQRHYVVVVVVVVVVTVYYYYYYYCFILLFITNCKSELLMYGVFGVSMGSSVTFFDTPILTLLIQLNFTPWNETN